VKTTGKPFRPKSKSRRATLTRVGFAVFLVLCLVALGWRVLRPILWPRLHPETPLQTSTRMFNDNSFLR
jgi:hypothetical protein